jgi:hypothetical protein
MSLVIKKLASKNSFAADLEISSRLCRCRFRNRQPKIVSLPIQKLATKNCVAADLEISN